MKSFTVSDEQSGKTIERVLSSKYKHLPKSALFKALRKKDIKVNGIRIKENHIVYNQDYVEAFITDAILFGTNKGLGYSIVFEDENLIIVNKEQGVPVHPDGECRGISLIEKVAQHVNKNHSDASGTDENFPALCHRLDRQTGGLVIIAKNKTALDFIMNRFKTNEIEKIYHCTVVGRPIQKNAELRSYLLKDEKRSRVFISDTPSSSYHEVITRFSVIRKEKIFIQDKTVELTDLEVIPVTGRTHQIRAHLAHYGLPVLGDGKYGVNEMNKLLGCKQQKLWAYSVEFKFRSNAGNPLSYLQGARFSIDM